MHGVAIGIRPHTGWAVVVGVTAPPDVRLLHRSRPDLVAEGDERFCWHLAQQEGLAPEDAAALADRVSAGAVVAAKHAIADALAETPGARVAAIVGEPAELPPPAEILRKHTLLHAAEGELFWSALAEAAESAGLEVVAVHPKTIDVTAHADLLDGLGKAAGRPWRVDHRLAVVAALDALRGG